MKKDVEKDRLLAEKVRLVFATLTLFEPYPYPYPHAPLFCSSTLIIPALLVKKDVEKDRLLAEKVSLVFATLTLFLTLPVSLCLKMDYLFSKEFLRECFEHLDMNGDESISLVEFVRLPVFGKNNSIFYKLDKNKSGSIDMDEFLEGILSSYQKKNLFF